MVQIVGVDSENLGKIALLLAQHLGQTTVMVFDDNGDKLSLMGPGTAQDAAVDVQQLDAMTRSYLETALWAETDNSTEQGGEPLEENYRIDDFSPASVAQARADCAEFERRAGALLDGIERRGHEVADVIGANFWLTRNGHRGGFWDGDYLKDISDALTKLAHEFGEITAIVGEDGKIHLDETSKRTTGKGE